MAGARHPAPNAPYSGAGVPYGSAPSAPYGGAAVPPGGYYGPGQGGYGGQPHGAPYRHPPPSGAYSRLCLSLLFCSLRFTTPAVK